MLARVLVPCLYAYFALYVQRAVAMVTPARCIPFHTTFPQGSVGADSSPFIPYSTPRSAYYFDNSRGLGLLLQKPSGQITKKGRVNSVTASGATINSTFLTLYGKFTFQVQCTVTPGVVVAATLIAPGGDEIDIELLGGDPRHWQTNIFAPQPNEKEPLYGVFGGLGGFGSDSETINSLHSYTVDWNSERIIWSVDGHHVRTIQKSETKKNGVLHYPEHPMRIQLGIWDASAPEGTSEWGKGPIDWSKAPSKMSAIFKSVRVECS